VFRSSVRPKYKKDAPGNAVHLSIVRCRRRARQGCVRAPPAAAICPIGHWRRSRMSDDLKADAVEQRCIFVRAQAGVIERVAPILPNDFTMGWPAIEHQDGRWRGVSSEHVEHPTLVVWSQVKEAIPSDHTVELTSSVYPLKACSATFNG
jgi:hypothetical protein